MSYTRPRFIREDYGAMNRNMVSQYKEHSQNMIDYFDEKIEDRKNYHADVTAQAEEMRTSGANIENFASKTSEEIEAEIQKFISSALEVEGTDKPGFFSQNIKEKRMTQQELDAVNANFNSEIKGINDVTAESFEKMLDLHDDYDKSSPGYKTFANIISGLRHNFQEGGSMGLKFDEETGKFKSQLTIPNPEYTPKMIGGKINPAWSEGVNEGVEPEVTFSSNELQSMLATNDSSNRTAHNEERDATMDTLEGKLKTVFDARKNRNEAYYSNLDEHGGVALTPEKEIYSQVDILLAEDNAANENDPNAPSMKDGIFDNDVNFNDGLRLKLLAGGTIAGGHQFRPGEDENVEGVEGGAELFGLVNNMVGEEFDIHDENKGEIVDGVMQKKSIGKGNTKTVAMEILGDLLDTPTHDYKGRAKDLERLYNLTGGEEAHGDLQEFIKKQEGTIGRYRDAATKRFVVNEMISRGIASDHIKAKKAPPTNTNNGGGGGGGNDATNIREVQIQDTTTNILSMGDEIDVDAVVSNYSQYDEQKLLPRNVVKNKDGSYEFEVKQGNWYEFRSNYNEDKISEEQFKEYMNDPVFAKQYQEAVSGAGYGEVDPSSMFAQVFDPERLSEGEIKIDGGNKQIHDSAYDNKSGQLTIYLEEYEKDPTAKNTKTYNLRTQNGYISYYLDRMGAGTQKERNELYDEGARQLVKDLVQNRYNTSSWGGNFPVEPLEMLDDGVVKEMYLTEKKIQDEKDYAAYFRQANPNMSAEDIEAHLKKIKEDSNTAEGSGNLKYYEDLIRELLNK